MRRVPKKRVNPIPEAGTAPQPAIVLPKNQALVAGNKWPVVGERAPRVSQDPWRVAVTGLVEEPETWPLAVLQGMPQVERRVDIHCVTRWSKPHALFGGVLLETLLQRCRPLPEARFVSFVARSDRNHSTSLPLKDALELLTLVALTYEGQPLAETHGGPVRTVVPGRYFYKSLKWLHQIELLAEDRLGYWEAENGYHNVADPWREQRYTATDLDRRKLAEILKSRDFSGHEILSLEADGARLPKLRARGAVLRNACFRRAMLRGACFDGGNLSNAHFEGADLRQASFVDSDAEGANFRGADLRGADFRGASLFGVTFCPEPGDAEAWGPAKVDPTTALDPSQIHGLSAAQQEFLRKT